MYYMSDTEINDKRNPKEFKGITFSKFQKVKVKKELIGVLQKMVAAHQERRAAVTDQLVLDFMKVRPLDF